MRYATAGAQCRKRAHIEKCAILYTNLNRLGEKVPPGLQPCTSWHVVLRLYWGSADPIGDCRIRPAESTRGYHDGRNEVAPAR
jgi:hypothetical protein